MVLEEKFRVVVKKFIISIGRLLLKYLLIRYPTSTLYKSCNFNIPRFLKCLVALSNKFAPDMNFTAFF